LRLSQQESLESSNTSPRRAHGALAAASPGALLPILRSGIARRRKHCRMAANGQNQDECTIIHAGGLSRAAARAPPRAVRMRNLA